MAELRLIEAICEALHEEMERDDSVVLLGEDVGVKGGVFGASKGLVERFGPTRVLDTPVSEIAIAGVAIGAAMMGLRPVAEFQFADYMMCSVQRDALSACPLAISTATSMI